MLRSAVYGDDDDAGHWITRPSPSHHSDSSDSDEEAAQRSSSSSSDSGDEHGSHSDDSSSGESRRSSHASTEGTLESVVSSAAPSLPTTQPTTGRRSASPQAAQAQRASAAASPALTDARASPALSASAATPPLVPHPPPRGISSRPSTRGSPTLSAASSPASTAAAGSAEATALAADRSHLNVAGSPIAPLAPRPPPKQARIPGRSTRRGLTPSQIAARAERKAAAAHAEAKEEALAEAADVAELSRIVAAAKPVFVASTELSVGIDGPSPDSVPTATRITRRLSLSSLPAPGAASSVPSSVSVLSRIDFLAASRAPVEDILSAKYNPDPADARAPDREKKMGYEVAYKEAREAAAMNPTTASNISLDWLPYHLQGDSSLYHSQILVVRDSLQYHPRLTKWFSRYWHSFAHHVHLGFMSFREYEAMHLRMTKVLFEKWDRKDAVALCRNDWRRDTRALPGVAVAITSTAGSGGAASLRATAGTLMGYPHFSKSLFELVDLWTTTVDVEEYVDFLAILYARITAVKDREIAPSITEAVEPLADSPGGSPNAPTRHHADPAHAHNATAEERRKRARAAAALADANRRNSGPLDLLGPSTDDPVAAPAAAAAAPSFSKPASPVPEEQEESSLSTVGGEQYWAGFGFMFQTNVDQVRERKRARAEALAFEAEHGGSEALAALRREDDRRRLHADGSIDSGTSKILPMVDHRTLIGDGYKIDPEDSLTKRFPAPDFAKMREQQMLADAAAAAERKRVQEEAELAFGLASSRVLENMPLSDEQRAEKKAERLAAKAAAEEKRQAAATAELAAQAPLEIEEAATKLAADLMPSSSSSDSEADDAKKATKAAETADSAALPKRSPSLKKGIPSLEQPTGAFAASLSSKKIRAVLKPSPALVAARAKRNKKSDNRSDADWAAATAARQEESRRQIIDKAIAARRQIRVHKALQAAQRRLAEVKKVEARRLAELAVKEERETDFFRQLDASIAVADPSYVAPALPPPTGRHRGGNSEFSSFDSSDILPEGDEAAAVEGGTPKSGHRSRQGGSQSRSRALSRSGSKKSLLRHSMPEAELEKLRADRARIEERKKQQRMEKAAAIAAGLDFVTIDDNEPEQLSDDPALADVEEEEEGQTGLRVGLAPVNESGAYDEYTPALQMQLSEEIAKLAMLDAHLRRSLPSASMHAAPGGGSQKIAIIGSPRRGPQKLVTAAEMQAARQALVAASNRLKFLRKKALLSRKSGMENRAELRELAELEAKLEGRISKNGDVLELSFLALAQQTNHPSDSDADVTGNSTYTGFGVRSLQAPGGGGGDPNWPASGGRNLRGVPGMGEEEAAKWKGDSKFWALRKRLARRRVLKYSAMAILTEVPSDEEKDEEQQRVLTIKLGAPTLAAHTGAATAAIGQRSSVISYKRTAIERVLLDDEEAKSRAGGVSSSFIPFLGDDSLNPDLDFESRLLHRRHTSFNSTMGGGTSGSGRGSRMHFSRRRDRSDSSNISRTEMSESTSQLLSILTSQAMEAAGSQNAKSNADASATNATDKPVELEESQAGPTVDGAVEEEPASSPSAPVAPTSMSASPSRAPLPALHRGVVHKSAAHLRRMLSPPQSSRIPRHHSSPRSQAAQAEIEWNKELGLHHAMAQAVQDAHRGYGGGGGGGGGATLLMAFSPPRAPRDLHAQSAPTLHRGSAAARLPKKPPRRTAFAPPLHATAKSEAPKLGVVAFGV